MPSCIACADTGIDSKGGACAACIMNVRGYTPAKVKSSIAERIPEAIVPNRSIVQREERFGIVMGHKRGAYDIAVVVNGEHVGNENWFRRDFDVTRQGKG